MKITTDKWIDFQKKMERAREKPAEVTPPGTPRVIHIGVEMEDGIIDVKMRVIAETEWLKFQEIWEQIIGAANSKNPIPRQTPHFFLICN